MPVISADKIFKAAQTFIGKRTQELTGEFGQFDQPFDRDWTQEQPLSETS